MTGQQNGTFSDNIFTGLWAPRCMGTTVHGHKGTWAHTHVPLEEYQFEILHKDLL